MAVVASVRERGAKTDQIQYNANRLDKVSYIQPLVLVVSRVEEHSLRPQVVVGRCMTRCQFVFNVAREVIKGPTALTR